MVQRGDYFRLHAFWAGLFLMCGAVVISGCGREEPAKAPEEAPPKVSKRVEGPQTRVLLQRMPDEAAAALATPSLSGPYLMALGLWERAQADPAAFREKIGASAQEWAGAWGVAVDAQDHLDVLRAVGVDVDGPAAVFVDGDSFAPQAESTKARQSEIDASDGAEAPPTAAKENDLPVGAAIIRCNDVERAEKALPGLVARAFAQPVTRESTEVAGIAMEQLSPAPFWYLFENKHLILGTSPEFVAAVVRKRDNPTPVRYGTPECPVDSDGEIVALARLAEMHKFEQAAQGQGPGPVVGLVMGQLLPSSGKDGAQISDDPLVTTLALEENRVALHSRLDIEKHPELLKLWGAPPRIDFLGLMPKTAKGAFSL
ncbi:MAG: hypothetical protein R6V12_19845, partial [Candidatus Hydrogenedentota bacterium]